jgi:hypothetical protein
VAVAMVGSLLGEVCGRGTKNRAGHKFIPLGAARTLQGANGGSVAQEREMKATLKTLQRVGAACDKTATDCWLG